MPTYQFICERCEAPQEFEQSIKDPLPEECPECGAKEAEGFHQVYNGDAFVFVRGEPTTFGQQAERNAKRVGKEQMQRMVEESEEAKEQAREKIRLPSGAERTKSKYKPAKPWWRDTDKPLDVSKIKDPKRYILDGEK